MQEQQEIDKRQSEWVLFDVQRVSRNTVCSGDLLVGVVYIIFNTICIVCCALPIFTSLLLFHKLLIMDTAELVPGTIEAKQPCVP